MSADNYLLARPYNDGWLITNESASSTWGQGENDSEGNYSDIDKAYNKWEARKGEPQEYPPIWCPNIEVAQRVMDDLYDYEKSEWFIEYGPSWVIEQE